MIRIGLLGYGGIGGVHAKAIRRIPNARLVAIGDHQSDRADRGASEYGARAHYSLESLVADPEIDMVDVCLPTYVHKEGVVAAAKAGKHVLCEKPIGLSLDQVDCMVDAVQQAGVRSMVAQVIRFWPAYTVVHDYLRRGELGGLISVLAARLVPISSTQGWFRDPALSGGSVLDLHIHDLDFIYYLFGRPRRVFAVGKQSASGSWDEVFTSLDYGERTAMAEANFMVPVGYPFTMHFRVLGSSGCLEYRFAKAGQVWDQVEEHDRLMAYLDGQAPQRLSVPDHDPYQAEIQYFVDRLDSGLAPEIATLHEAREVLEIALAARRSMETGQVVDLSTANRR
jgi:predicted dehydrogenase